jgi:hypothetical protein
VRDEQGTVETETVGDVTVVTLIGEFDLANAGQVGEKLVQPWVAALVRPLPDPGAMALSCASAREDTPTAGDIACCSCGRVHLELLRLME